MALSTSGQCFACSKSGSGKTWQPTQCLCANSCPIFVSALYRDFLHPITRTAQHVAANAIHRSDFISPAGSQITGLCDHQQLGRVYSWRPGSFWLLSTYRHCRHNFWHWSPDYPKSRRQNTSYPSSGRCWSTYMNPSHCLTNRRRRDRSEYTASYCRRCRCLSTEFPHSNHRDDH